MSRVTAGVRSRPWMVAFGVAAVIIAVLRLSALGTSPPGLYNDEASIGYNAWSIAHHGVDEHGHAFPLYFEAFGEYKNPLYVYLLAPFTLVLPLTPYVERLPAALCGLGTVAVVGLAGWELTRRRDVALAAVLTAAFTPWLVLQSRVGFELPVMTLTLALAVYAFARGTREGGPSARWLAASGVCLALSIFAYSTGRAYVGAVVVLMLLVDRGWRSRRMVPLLLPVGAGYAVLGLDALRNPGQLTGRFNGLSITADDPGLVTAAGRLVRNYLTYWGVPFLFTNGDQNLRHSTGYGGMLLVTTLPLLVLGLVACLRSVRRPAPRLLLVMLVLAPVPAALTAEGTPHALRASTMLVPLLLVMALGWNELLPRLSARRLLAGLAAAALAVDAGGFMWDLFRYYPDRSAAFFDAGELQAVRTAHDLAAASGHHVYISATLDVPYIQVLFALTPPAVDRPAPDNQAAALAQVGVTVLPSARDMEGTAQAGDLLVIAPGEAPPEGAQLVEQEAVTPAPENATLPAGLYGLPPPQPIVLVLVYRR